MTKWKLFYENNLSKEEDVKDFTIEGPGKVSFHNNRMRLESTLDYKVVGEQKGNFLFWCNLDMPADLKITWEFKPLNEPGLAMMFFCAKGKNGEDLFSEGLLKREGEYPQYNRSDINAYHISYFRRRLKEEIAFHTCNLRKSYGAYLLKIGGDPLPSAEDILKPYSLSIEKIKGHISFSIQDPSSGEPLEVFSCEDTKGEILGRGKIGFRQMAPLVGEYGNLKVYMPQKN